LQDFNYARLTKEAKAYNLAYLIKEAKALDVKIDSKNTIIMHILKRSLIKGKSYIIYINFTSYINLITLCKKGKN
jgi:hypothetical protein